MRIAPDPIFRFFDLGVFIHYRRVIVNETFRWINACFSKEILAAKKARWYECITHAEHFINTTLVAHAETILCGEYKYKMLRIRTPAAHMELLWTMDNARHSRRITVCLLRQSHSYWSNAHEPMSTCHCSNLTLSCARIVSNTLEIEASASNFSATSSIQALLIRWKQVTMWKWNKDMNSLFHERSINTNAIGKEDKQWLVMDGKRCPLFCRL